MLIHYFFSTVLLFSLLFSSCKKKELEVFPLGGDFSLQTASGEVFQISKQKQKWRFVFFGYTSCPDFCPNTLSKLSQVQNKIGEIPEVLFINLDANSSPKDLETYLGHFKIPAIALTGTETEIRKVLGQFKGNFQVKKLQPSGLPLIDHTTYLYLLDPQNRVRYLFKSVNTAEEIANVLEVAL